MSDRDECSSSSSSSAGSENNIPDISLLQMFKFEPTLLQQELKLLPESSDTHCNSNNEEPRIGNNTLCSCGDHYRLCKLTPKIGGTFSYGWISKPQQLSTYALTLFKYFTKIDDRDVNVEFWDTAGQERFSSMHPSYYHSSHACILVFDVTRKNTYKNLASWYKELREYRPDIPVILLANKIDVDYNVTKKSFNFAKKYHLPFYFVSASDGTNVVKVFREAIRLGLDYKENATDFVDEVLKELENFDDLNIDTKTSSSTSPVSSSELTARDETETSK